MAEGRRVFTDATQNSPSDCKKLGKHDSRKRAVRRSAHLITDYKGDEYERVEYTPYGEYWIEKRASENRTLPFKFTGKERDEETGLYYYGARYLDAKTSRWLTTDPALGEYVSGTEKGEGGIYNQVNFNLYHYAGNNPVKYTDPDGKVFCLVTAGIGAGIGFAYGAYKSYTETGAVDLREAGKDALIGGIIGLGLGATAAVALTGSATASVTAVAVSAKAAVAVTFGAGGTITTMGEKAWGNLQRAEEFGIQAYSDLRNAIANTGLQAHHIIEKRFLPALQKLGLTANKMLSVAVTPEEHQVFTNAWRSFFKYGKTKYEELSVSQIWELHKKYMQSIPNY
ncbi:RHS repeat-associated core domain-containing protein [Treponema sp. OMZ 840]|uniref:RHS repeat-associated core domain-containing protein n=1 Tax=Treponema sp. OMZ 840 TaxID=244313 RepID=UPI003D91FB0F